MRRQVPPRRSQRPVSTLCRRLPGEHPDLHAGQCDARWHEGVRVPAETRGSQAGCGRQRNEHPARPGCCAVRPRHRRLRRCGPHQRRSSVGVIETRTSSDPVPTDQDGRSRGRKAVRPPDQAARDDQVRRAGRNRQAHAVETERRVLVDRQIEHIIPESDVSGTAHPRVACVSSLLLLALHVWSGTARAQAWGPAGGEGTVSLTYQNYDVAGHFDTQGHKNTNGGTQSHALVTELDYGVTDTIGLIVSLPFIASKYTGPPSYFVGTHETHPGPLDDGTYHAAFQDVRVEVRRLFWAGP